MAHLIRKKKAVPETDEKGTPIITHKYLVDLCEELDQWTSPHLNDFLYLHYKGNLPHSSDSDSYRLH
jgi:hypothetical protein